MFNKVALEA